MTVGELEARMSFTELQQWKAYKTTRAQIWEKTTGKGKKGQMIDFW